MKPFCMVTLFLLLPLDAAAQCYQEYRRVPYQSSAVRPHFSYQVILPPVDECEPVPAPPDDEAAPLEAPVIDANDEEEFHKRAQEQYAPPKPPWHFPKTLTLPAFRGGHQLPFRGRRGCGPFAIASALDAHGHSLDNSTFADLVTLDPEGNGTSPDTVMGYLKKFFHVTARSQASVSELIQHLDKGLPVLIVVEVEDDPHWALVTGYETDHDNNPVSWTLTDNGFVNGPVSNSNFLTMWDCSERYQNYALFIGPNGARDAFEKSIQLPTFSLPRHVTSTPNHVYLLATIFHQSGYPMHQAECDHIQQELDPNGDGLDARKCVAYLERYFDVQKAEPATPIDLTTQLDAGLPVLLVLNTSDGWLHWTLLTGYTTDNFDSYLSWTILDDIGKTEISHDELLAAWDNEYSRNLGVFLAPNSSKPKPVFPDYADHSWAVSLAYPTYSTEADTNDCSAARAVIAFATALNNAVVIEEPSYLQAAIGSNREQTTSQELVDFLEQFTYVYHRHRFDAERIKTELDLRRPIILSLATENGPQWAVITGYRTDRTGRIRSCEYVMNGTHFEQVPFETLKQNWNARAGLIYSDPRAKFGIENRLLGREILELTRAQIPAEETRDITTEPIFKVPVWLQEKAPMYIIGIVALSAFAFVLVLATRPRFETN